MEVPHVVKEKAKELIDTFGEHFEKLGIYQEKQVYKFVFPKGLRTGFPYVYLYDEHTKDAEAVTGNKALEIITSAKWYCFNLKNSC